MKNLAKNLILTIALGTIVCAFSSGSTTVTPSDSHVIVADSEGHGGGKGGHKADSEGHGGGKGPHRTEQIA